jgi:hypothetical protein
MGQRRVALADRREVGQPVIARDVGEVVVGQPRAGDVEDVAFGDAGDVPDVSMIALSDVVRSEVFDGLPGSASRAL